MPTESDAPDLAEQRPAWAWIDRSALRHNARRALELARGRAVIGVIKADGYGHGAVETARGLLAAGVTDRTGNVWSPAETALANGRLGNEVFEGGEWTKILLREEVDWSKLGK